MGKVELDYREQERLSYLAKKSRDEGEGEEDVLSFSVRFRMIVDRYGQVDDFLNYLEGKTVERSGSS